MRKVRAPHQVFMQPQRLVVPVFQRRTCGTGNAKESPAAGADQSVIRAALVTARNAPATKRVVKPCAPGTYGSTSPTSSEESRRQACWPP